MGLIVAVAIPVLGLLVALWVEHSRRGDPMRAQRSAAYDDLALWVLQVEGYLMRHGRSAADDNVAPELDRSLASRLETYQSATLGHLVHTLRWELLELTVGRMEMADVRRQFVDRDDLAAEQQRADTLTYVKAHRDAALAGCTALTKVIRAELGAAPFRWRPGQR